MSRQAPALRYALHVAGCMLPFLALPPLCALLPGPALQAATFAFVYPLCPALSALVPFRMARRGAPPILAWPWPLLATLRLTLHGSRPELAVKLLGALVARAGAARAAPAAARQAPGARRRPTDRAGRARRRGAWRRAARP